MKIVGTLGTFKDALATSNPRTKKLAKAVRKLIADVYPKVVEVPWPRLKVIGYGIGPKKATEHFCYIAPYGEYVNVGFNYGLVLPDPDELMEGSGKKFRHVKIKTLEDVERPGLKKLLQSAVKEREHAFKTNTVAIL
jgi:hypothetical protein